MSRPLNVMVRVASCIYLSLFAQNVTAATLTISELEDLDFGTTVPTGSRLRQQARFCVSMEPGGFYQIRAIGSGTGGAFTLSAGDGELNEIRYRVRVRNQRLRPGVIVSGFRARPPNPSSNGGGGCIRQRLTVIIPRGELQRAAGGNYQGTLAITVAPE